MDPLQSYYNTIKDLKKKGLYTPVRVLESKQGAWIKVDGKRVLNFCSNNYLGLASHERLIQGAISAVKKYGVGPGAVRPISGNLFLHMKAEEMLAKFKRAAACLLVPGGFVANIIAIQTIMGKEDIVISDELNHASIIDAIRVAQIGNKFIYKHTDMVDLEQRLKDIQKLAKTPQSDGGRRLVMIVTDGVFSMDGDIAPLPQVVKLAKKYNAVTMVDDAHGEGVLGSHGRGIVDHFHLHGKVDIEVGTLSKALGVMGGMIAGRRELIEYYRQKGRPYLFSTGLTVADSAAVIESVRILSDSDALVKKLWHNARYLKLGLKQLGFDTGKSETPITPVMIGDENMAKTLSLGLLERRVFASAIKYPMVALGRARIRVMPSASHSRGDLDYGLAQFARVGRQLGAIS